MASQETWGRKRTREAEGKDPNMEDECKSKIQKVDNDSLPGLASHSYHNSAVGSTAEILDLTSVTPNSTAVSEHDGDSSDARTDDVFDRITFKCSLCYKELPSCAVGSLATEWVCIACQVTFLRERPEKAADVFFSANKARVESVKYGEPPVDKILPSRQLKETTYDNNLQGFYHPACPLYCTDTEKYEACLEDNINSVPDLLQHLKVFHSHSLPHCARCLRNFEEVEERDLHQERCERALSSYPVGAIPRIIDETQRAYIKLLDMTLSQEGAQETARLASVHSEVRNTKCAIHRMQETGTKHFGFFFKWTDECFEEHHENYPACDSSDSNLGVYLRTGAGFWMSVYHDLWMFYFEEFMPRAVARNHLGKIYAHLDDQAH